MSQHRRQEIERLIDHLRGQINRWRKAKLDDRDEIDAGKIPQSVFEIRREEHERNIAAAEAEIQRLEAERDALPDDTAAVPTTDSKPHVFISYARRDGSGFCEQLYNQLTAAGFNVWRDKRDLDPYKGFEAEIEKVLENATHVAAVITPDVKREESFVRCNFPSRL